jgi:hypothetical protein
VSLVGASIAAERLLLSGTRRSRRTRVMEQLMDMVAVSRLNAQRHMRTKTHVWKAAQRMQRVSVAMAGVVPLLSRFTGAHLRRVRSTQICSLCQLCATCV